MRPGDVVALLLSPSFAYPIAYLAAAKLGCVTAGINPRFGQREIAHIVASSEAAVVIADRDAPGRVIEPADLTKGDDEPPDAAGALEDPVAIVYTSGTTGLPKGATFTQSNLEAVRRIEEAMDPGLDHTSGLPAVVAEGITIVTPEVNKDFLMTALSAPRTLAPDA